MRISQEVGGIVLIVGGSAQFGFTLSGPKVTLVIGLSTSERRSSIEYDSYPSTSRQLHRTDGLLLAASVGVRFVFMKQPKASVAVFRTKLWNGNPPGSRCESTGDVPRDTLQIYKRFAHPPLHKLQ